jgi:hypothetical protein
LAIDTESKTLTETDKAHSKSDTESEKEEKTKDTESEEEEEAGPSGLRELHFRPLSKKDNKYANPSNLVPNKYDH